MRNQLFERVGVAETSHQVSLCVLLAQGFKHLDHAVLALNDRLTTREVKQGGVLLQRTPDFQTAQFFYRLPLPFTAIRLQQAWYGDDLQFQGFGKWQSSFHGAFHGAGINGFDGYAGELVSQRLGLLPTRWVDMPARHSS